MVSDPLWVAERKSSIALLVPRPARKRASNRFRMVTTATSLLSVLKSMPVMQLAASSLNAAFNSRFACWTVQFLVSKTARKCCLKLIHFSGVDTLKLSSVAPRCAGGAAGLMRASIRMRFCARSSARLASWSAPASATALSSALAASSFTSGGGFSWSASITYILYYLKLRSCFKYLSSTLLLQ